MKYFKSILCSLSLILVSPSAFSDDSYDGNLVICPEAKIVTLNYFDAALPVLDPKGPNVVNMEGMSQQGVIDFALRRLEGTLYKVKLESALDSVGPVEDWISADLKDTSQRWYPYDIPSECKRVQGSARISNVLYIDPVYARDLEPSQLGVLRLHEAVALISGKKNPYDYNYSSIPFERELVRRILNLDYTIDDIGEAIQELGHKAFPYEEELDSKKRVLMTNLDGNISDGRKACGLSISEDSKFPDYFLQYSSFGSSGKQDSRFCYVSDKPKLKCSIDVKECTIIDGGMEDGWKAGCKIRISTTANQRKNWEFSCPDSNKTWNFQY